MDLQAHSHHRTGQGRVFAYCPELKGCHTQGDTVEEALANLREAAGLYLETLSEHVALFSR